MHKILFFRLSFTTCSDKTTLMLRVQFLTTTGLPGSNCSSEHTIIFARCLVHSYFGSNMRGKGKRNLKTHAFIYLSPFLLEVILRQL